MSQLKRFIFKDINNPRNEITCEVNITVTEEISNNYPIYKIEFSYKYNNTNNKKIENDKIISPHPFTDFSNMKDFCYGGIVAKNSMTEQMVIYMMMDNEDLLKVCGITDTQHYRNIIMINLMLLWD